MPRIALHGFEVVDDMPTGTHTVAREPAERFAVWWAWWLSIMSRLRKASGLHVPSPPASQM